MVAEVKNCRKCKVEMKYGWSDADDMGDIEEWLECPKCGKTCDIPKVSKVNNQGHGDGDYMKYELDTIWTAKNKT